MLFKPLQCCMSDSAIAVTGSEPAENNNGSVNMYNHHNETDKPSVPSHVKELKEYCAGSKEYNEAVFIGNLSYETTRPRAVIYAQTTEDVVRAVLDAKDKKVPFTVRGGGHGYGGYCLNNDGLMVDLSMMKKVQINRDTMTARVQGGATWDMVYEKLKGDNVDLMVIGGQCPSVGVGGFTLGGGLSPFSRSYGLAVDNVLKLTVVTAEGKIVQLSNEEKDPSRKNLFWALMGGGGGNFGIVTEFTFRVHKMRGDNFKMVAGQLKWPVYESVEVRNAFLSAMNAFNTMEKPDELCMDAFWNYEGGDEEKLQAQMTILYNGSMEKCVENLAPILCHGPENGLKEMFFYQWEIHDRAFFQFENIYQRHMSIILEEDAITQEVTQTILDLMKEAPTLSPGDSAGASMVNKCRIVWDHIGGATSRVEPGSTAFPWRNGAYVLDAMAQWGDDSQSAEAAAWIDKCRKCLAPYSIEKRASYVNYIDPWLSDWRYAYYGNNYERLRLVKTAWDPENFFSYAQGIEPTTKNTIASIEPTAAKNIVATIPYFGLSKKPNALLEGKAAVVTGGEGGMGKEICRQLGRLGCSVMIAGRNAAKVNATMQTLKAEGLDIRATQTDVTSDEDIKKLVEACEREFEGVVDVLVNNAGVNFDQKSPPEMTALDKAVGTMEVNFFGPVRVTTALTPLLAKSGSCRIINVSTMMASSGYIDAQDWSLPYPEFPLYKSSKQALNNWSREAAVEFKTKGIMLNVVNPGWVKTSMGGDDAPDTVLDGIQATLYLATTNDIHYGGFFERFTGDGTPPGMVNISARPW